MIGNPTNPTSVLHPAAALRALLRPGRTVVVDEAFMDAVPGEPDSLIADQMTGLIVLRSLTKTWALAGLRAGYAVGDPPLIDALRHQQPPWSVSTPALAAITACLTPAALAEAAKRRRHLHRPPGRAHQPPHRPGASARRRPPRAVPAPRHQPRPRPPGPRAGSGSGSGTEASPYAAATPSPGSARTGSGSPYATPTPPGRSPPPWPTWSEPSDDVRRRPGRPGPSGGGLRGRAGGVRGDQLPARGRGGADRRRRGSRHHGRRPRAPAA